MLTKTRLRSFNLIKGRFPAPWGVRSAKKWLFHTPSACGGVVDFYKLRFQIEFLFRDAKQFAGLEDCQARDLTKLEFHFNASLTALNLAKVEAQQQQSRQERVPFSMTSVKRRTLNQHLLNRFIATFDLEPTLIKSHPNYSTLCNYGIIAA